MALWRLLKKSPVAQLLVVLTALNVFMLGGGSAEARTPDRAPAAEIPAVDARTISTSEAEPSETGAGLPDTTTVVAGPDADLSELGLPDTVSPWVPNGR